MASTISTPAPSRRAMLGALAFTPIAISAPATTLISSPDSAWAAGMKRYVDTHAAYQTAYAQYRQMSESDKVKYGAAMDALTDADGEAEDFLMQTPAPHRAALLWKLEHTIVDEGDHLMAMRLPYVAQTRADMRQLLV